MLSGYELPAVKYNFNKQNSIFRSLFIMCDFLNFTVQLSSVINAYLLTCSHLIISFITTVTIHYSSLSLQAQN